MATTDNYLDWFLPHRQTEYSVFNEQNNKSFVLLEGVQLEDYTSRRSNKMLDWQFISGVA